MSGLCSESCSAVGPHRGGVCYAQARVCELCLGVGPRRHTPAFFDTYSSVCVCARAKGGRRFAKKLTHLEKLTYSQTVNLIDCRTSTSTPTRLIVDLLDVVDCRWSNHYNHFLGNRLSNTLPLPPNETHIGWRRATTKPCIVE